METGSNVQEQSPFFKLPKELRLTIYDYVLGSVQPILIGTYVGKEKHIADWPFQPSIVNICSLFRREALPIYFSTAHFIFNLQSRLGLVMVLHWIKTNSESCPTAFNNLRHVTIIAGSGLYERPEEWELDFHLREVVSTRMQLPVRNIMFGESLCASPAYYGLKVRLLRIPEKRNPVGFDMGAFLKEIVDMVIRLSD